MGLSYLKGKSRGNVTREERFFCRHLFKLVQCHGVNPFVNYLKHLGALSLEPDAYWEAAYEACFYRGPRHLSGREDSLHSPKRTYDPALLSEAAVGVIEAKVHEIFKSDQLQTFRDDKKQKIPETTGVNEPHVLILPLTGRRYRPSQETLETYFARPYLTWRDPSRYDFNDWILERADTLCQPHLKTGPELLEAHNKKEDLPAGRGGGLEGRYLREDIESGDWESRPYENKPADSGPPGGNWFGLADFSERVDAHVKRKEDY